MIRIAIDGPGGAGKSTVAKSVAKQLGIIYVDTGALYRTIGLHMLKNGIDPKDAPNVAAALPDFTLELKFVDGKQTVLLDGEDVGDRIRTPEASMAATSSVPPTPDSSKRLTSAPILPPAPLRMIFIPKGLPSASGRAERFHAPPPFRSAADAANSLRSPLRSLPP